MRRQAGAYTRAGCVCAWGAEIEKTRRSIKRPPFPKKIVPVCSRPYGHRVHLQARAYLIPSPLLEILRERRGGRLGVLSACCITLIHAPPTPLCVRPPNPLYLSLSRNQNDQLPVDSACIALPLIALSRQSCLFSSSRLVELHHPLLLSVTTAHPYLSTWPLLFTPSRALPLCPPRASSSMSSSTRLCARRLPSSTRSEQPRVALSHDNLLTFVPLQLQDFAYP